MAWDNFEVRLEHDSEDGVFQIVEGEFDGAHRYGMRWTHWHPFSPIVIPPAFDADIESMIEDYDDDDEDNDDEEDEDEDEDEDDDDEEEDKD